LDELINQTISHYRITGRLGAGGMGVVYRAHDERLERDLALKLLPCDTMADKLARIRLLGEARTVSSLNHPHIAHIYDVGEDRGHLFVAMELIEGKPLRELIPKGGLPSPTVVRYGYQIADALAFAHERGVIHRDLKSANVMITPEGRVKVLDFGLAKHIRDEEEAGEEDTSLTATGMVLGTPNYLPPEVLLGGKADTRSDVWALGVLLYEMASGKLPFGGGSVAELAGAIVNNAPNPLSGRVPTGLQMVVTRCLAKEPSARYGSAKEVRAVLESMDPGAARQRATRVSRGAILAAVGAAIVVALGVTLALHTGDLKERLAGGAMARPRIGSLAVLPLANLSGDPAQEYFADGMTEELITDLAPIRSLKVISRTSVMPYKNSKKSLRAIANELGVDAIVEGSVLKAGDRVRITAQLIEAAKDQHLWAKSYERELRDVLTLQSEVARDIAREIQLQLSPQEMKLMMRKRPMNPQAYELYLKGRYEWNKLSRESIGKGLQYYERALALDPGDARYSAGLADAYLILAQIVGSIPPKEGMKKVKEYARRALAADDSSAEAHTSMAAGLLFGDWNWAEAERHVLQAIQLNPGYSTAHLVYSVILGTTGRVNEAIEQDHLAMDLDPLSFVINWNASSTLFYARRYDEAIAQSKKALEVDPTSGLGYGSLIRIYEQRGDYPAALDALDMIEKQAPDMIGGPGGAAKIRKAYAEGGPDAYWRVVLARNMASKNPAGFKDIGQAMIYTKLGDRERAIASLERAYAAHSSDMLFVNAEPCFDPLRGDPRFQAIIRRLGLTPST